MMLPCRYPPEEVASKSSEQGNLLVTYGPPIEQRVGAETINTVVTGGPKLRESLRKQFDSHTDKTAYTEVQKQRLRFVATFLAARRKAIAKEFRGDSGTRETFGLGTKLLANTPSSVTHCIEVFVNAADQHPDKVKAAAIGADDIDKLKQFITELEAIEQTQESKKSSSKESTAARNVLQGQIEAAMVKIVQAATMVFADRPEVVALFQSTLPKRKSGSRKSTGETDDDSTNTPSSSTEDVTE